jgi:hypothetical protein
MMGLIKRAFKIMAKTIVSIIWTIKLISNESIAMLLCLKSKPYFKLTTFNYFKRDVKPYFIIKIQAI